MMQPKDSTLKAVKFIPPMEAVGLFPSNEGGYKFDEEAWYSICFPRPTCLSPMPSPLICSLVLDFPDLGLMGYKIPSCIGLWVVLYSMLPIHV
jgi:hypothetical protein